MGCRAARDRQTFAVGGHWRPANLFDFFMSLDDGRQECKDWRGDYNKERPHSTSGNFTPMEEDAIDPQHKISRVTARALRMPTDFSWLGLDRKANNAIGFVEVETDTGLVGYGVTN